jgi:hypothetical protein
LTRPANSSIRFGRFPAASITVGLGMCVGILLKTLAVGLDAFCDKFFSRKVTKDPHRQQ